MRLKGKVAIITGASSGIGAATAELFAREGAAVVLAARRKERLEENVRAICAAGGRAKAVVADVTKLADCERIVAEAKAEFGRLDILVNNAGIADRHLPIDKCSPEWWDKVILVDQTSVFYMTKAALEAMMPANAGSIVNVSSIGGVFGIAGISYSTAKSGLLGFTKNIAVEFAGKGIRCNAVCPGATVTELFEPENMADMDRAFNEQCALHMNTTLPPTRAEEQANAILFFASDEASAVTGQILVVDNGATL